MKFEHRIKIYNQVATFNSETGQITRNDAVYDFQEDAENLGSQGWELIGIAMTTEGILAAYKRQAAERKKVSNDKA